MGIFVFFELLILAIIIFGAYKLAFPRAGKISADGSMVCPHCGTRGEPKIITQGSIAIELILWLFFIIPGVIYFIWRLTTRKKVCPSCGQAGMIPASSPNGERLIVANLRR